MSLHIITGSSAAARLDSTLGDLDDVLLLENARVWNQHESTGLDPVQHTRALQRTVLVGRQSKGRKLEIPEEFAKIGAIRRGDPICVWSARNLDDAILSLWIFNHLDTIGYDTRAVSFVRVFGTMQGDPISSVEQLSDADIAVVAGQQWRLNKNEIAFFRDRWVSISADSAHEFAKVFAVDYSLLKGWQDVLLSVLQRLPTAAWGHAPEAVVLFECLRVAQWDEGKAFIQYVTQLPFSPSKLRQPDARAVLAAIRTEVEKSAFRVGSMEDVGNVFRSANSRVSQFCVPFFWRDSFAAALPPGIGARLLS